MSTTTTRPTTGHLMDLPGQQHVAEGPLDLNGMYMAHHAFRRDLARFAVAARRTPVEEVEVWRALAVRWEQFGSILHHHHTTEDDVLWPQLLDIVDARGDADGRATLEAMEAEHSVIDPMLAACAAGFAAMAQAPDAATRDRLAASTETARDTLSDHMGHEEREALPLVQELLSAEGWQRVEKAAGSGKGLELTALGSVAHDEQRRGRHPLVHGLPGDQQVPVPLVGPEHADDHRHRPAPAVRPARPLGQGRVDGGSTSVDRRGRQAVLDHRDLVRR